MGRFPHSGTMAARWRDGIVDIPSRVVRPFLKIHYRHTNNTSLERSDHGNYRNVNFIALGPLGQKLQGFEIWGKSAFSAKFSTFLL